MWRIDLKQQPGGMPDSTSMLCVLNTNQLFEQAGQ